MPDYQVVRIRREPCPKSRKLFHVLSVGTGDWTIYNRVWTIEELCEALDAGDHFFIRPRDSAEQTELVCVQCPACGATTVATTRDSEVGLELLPPIAP
jgi:hypothetical protein